MVGIYNVELYPFTPKGCCSQPHRPAPYLHSPLFMGLHNILPSYSDLAVKRSTKHNPQTQPKRDETRLCIDQPFLHIQDGVPHITAHAIPTATISRNHILGITSYTTSASHNSSAETSSIHQPCPRPPSKSRCICQRRLALPPNRQYLPKSHRSPWILPPPPNDRLLLHTHLPRQAHRQALHPLKS